MKPTEETGRTAAPGELATSFENEKVRMPEAEWGGTGVAAETYLAEFDDAPFLRGLPDDLCQCPHGGYLRSGRMTVRYPDRVEVVEAGDLYYTSPGHSLVVAEGTERVEFSPAEEFRRTAAVAEKNIAEFGLS